MKPITKIVLVSLLVIAVVGLTVTGIAYAQNGGPHPRERLAELLGLTPDEIRQQIQSGTTLQDLATDAGIDLEAYHKSVKSDREEQLQERIQEMLAEEEISRDQADWLLEGLEKGYLFSPFFRPDGRFPGNPENRPEMDREGFPGRQNGDPFSSED